MKNNNIEFLPLEFFQYNACPELPTIHISSSSYGGYSGNLGSSQWTNNPGISDPSSGSGQPGNSGSNSSGDPDPIRNFEAHRRTVGSKLRDLYVNKPPLTRILMTDAAYLTKINAWDHNVVCRSLLDAGSDLQKNIVLHKDSSRYNGYISIELLGILER